MKRRQIPQGYTSSFVSHTDPAIAPPPPPIVQEKQAQTLMGHCLKEFIKERLYGNMINYSRNSQNKQPKFIPFRSGGEDTGSSIVRSTSAMQNLQLRKLSQVRENTQKRMSRRYQNIVKNTDSRLEHQRGSYHNSFGQMDEDMIQSRHRKNMSALSNKYSSNQDLDKSTDGDGQKYKFSGFISAIEQDQHKGSRSLNKKKQKLSPLMKTPQLAERLQKIKSMTKSPSPSRFDIDKYGISSTFWQSVNKRPKKHEIQLDNSIANLLTRDQSATVLENKSLGSNGFMSLKGNNNSQLQSVGALDKSKYFLVKPCFSKEMLSEHLGNPKYSFKALGQMLFQFFQFNNRINDDMKIQDYKQVMELIVKAGSRVWAVCAFRFWDVDMNSLICSNDIFKIFKELDALKTELMTKPDYENLKGYKIIESLMKTVDEMRSLILEQRLEQDLANNSKQQNNKSEHMFEIKYLEQAILRNKQVRYSDLMLILGQNIKNTVKDNKKSVIETKNELRIKMSSCYRYSFLATDHNEQTRMDRQHIETLKQSLREEKMKLVKFDSDNELINKKLPGISYTTFVQKKLYKSMKDLACLTFGIDLS